jgi:hypothetical protein
MDQRGVPAILHRELRLVRLEHREASILSLFEAPIGAATVIMSFRLTDRCGLRPHRWHCLLRYLSTKTHSFIVSWKYRKQEKGTLVAQQDDFSMTNEGIERKMLGSRSLCAELPGWFTGKIFGRR